MAPTKTSDPVNIASRSTATKLYRRERWPERVDGAEQRLAVPEPLQTYLLSSTVAEEPAHTNPKCSPVKACARRGCAYGGNKRSTPKNWGLKTMYMGIERQKRPH